MLSRVADALFWMHRYLERAEHVARLLDVSFHLELDLHGVLVGPYEWHWNSLVAILQQQNFPRNGDHSPQVALTEWLTFDLNNPGSILSCLNRARNNARSIRDVLPPEVWGALNRLHWQLRDLSSAPHARESPMNSTRPSPLAAIWSGPVRRRCFATRVGISPTGQVPRTRDKTLRILDVKYHLLNELTNPADLPLLNLQWAGVLPQLCGV